MIAGGDVMAQRVTLSAPDPNVVAYIASEESELTGAGGIAPANAFLIVGQSPTTFVLAPGQNLRAACRAQDAGMPLSLSISSVAPIPADRNNPLYAPAAPVTYVAKVLPIRGTAPVTMVRPSIRPQRVLLQNADRAVYVTSTEQAGSVTSPPPAPALIPFAYWMFPFQGSTFILAPGQGMVGVGINGNERVSVSASEISLQHVLGTAGIPGPASGNG